MLLDSLDFEKIVEYSIEFGKAEAVEDGMIVEGSSELDADQLFDKTMDEDPNELIGAPLLEETMDPNELDKSTSVEDETVVDDSNELDDDWEMSLNCAIEEEIGVLTKEDKMTDEVTDSDTDEVGAPEDASKYEELKWPSEDTSEEVAV